MASVAPQLVQHSLETADVFREDSVFDLYGRWNALIAETVGGCHLGWCPAHDGDFFPESPIDHVEAMRAAILRGDKHINSAWPVRVDIDITQRCNSACVFCFSRPYYPNSAYRGSVATLEVLSRIVEDLAARGTRCVRYCGGGDPLTHPDIERLLCLPRQHGLRSCVITNGDLLDERLADVILDQVDHLRWSVNAATNTTRQKLHRPGPGANELTRTFEIVERIARQRGNGRRPMIWATFLLMPENFDEVIAVTRLLKQVGVDSLSFRPVYHELGGTWSDSETQRLKSILRKAKSLETSARFLVFVPKRSLKEADSLLPAQHFPTCLSRRLRTVAEATTSGLALQTCGMWRGTGLRSGTTVTNEIPFEAAWQALKEGGPPTFAPKDCRQCMDVSANVTLNFIWKTLLTNPEAQFYKAHVEVA